MSTFSVVTTCWIITGFLKVVPVTGDGVHTTQSVAAKRANIGCHSSKKSRKQAMFCIFAEKFATPRVIIIFFLNPNPGGENI